MATRGYSRVFAACSHTYSAFMDATLARTAIAPGTGCSLCGLVELAGGIDVAIRLPRVASLGAPDSSMTNAPAQRAF
jgi:hypothetical protein